MLIVMHSTFQLELDAAWEELDATRAELDAATDELDTMMDEELGETISELLAGGSLTELLSIAPELLEADSTSSLLLGKTSLELLAISVALLDSGVPSQLLEDCASQLQGAFPAGALRFSVSQATSVRARSDTAESPHAMLVILFFIGL